MYLYEYIYNFFCDYISHKFHTFGTIRLEISGLFKSIVCYLIEFFSILFDYSICHAIFSIAHVPLSFSSILTLLFFTICLYLHRIRALHSETGKNSN